MAKIISQETFDDVVKENVIDFSMSPDEAKEETIQQFEAQGINLANIIKDLTINKETGIPILNEIVDNLKTHIGEKSRDTQQLLEYLTILDAECQKSIPHRVLAGKNGAHDTLITLLEQEIAAETELNGEPKPTNDEVVVNCLKAVNSLTNKQPDLFDAEALAIIIKIFNRNQTKQDILCLTLQWLQKACIMHEINRQNIVNADIMKHLKPLINNQNSVVLRDVLALLRYLVLDDDIRVAIGKAHEHAKIIAAEVIVELTKLLPEFNEDNVLADLMLTIGVLAVREEFCTAIEDAGGIQYAFTIIRNKPTSVRLSREYMKLMRVLAGNDKTKVHLIQKGAAPIIKNILELHMSNEPIATATLACISSLTLRVGDNSVAFYETGIAEIIVETLRMHRTSKMVQRNGAWAIRNMVARSRNQCDSFISFGVEDLLNEAMIAHPTVKQDIKAALRDLGCKVELKEEFTGKAEKKILKSYA